MLAGQRARQHKQCRCTCAAAVTPWRPSSWPWWLGQHTKGCMMCCPSLLRPQQGTRSPGTATTAEKPTCSKTEYTHTVVRSTTTTTTLLLQLGHRPSSACAVQLSCNTTVTLSLITQVWYPRQPLARAAVCRPQMCSLLHTWATFHSRLDSAPLPSPPAETHAGLKIDATSSEQPQLSLTLPSTSVNHLVKLGKRASLAVRQPGCRAWDCREMHPNNHPNPGQPARQRLPAQAPTPHFKRTTSSRSYVNKRASKHPGTQRHKKICGSVGCARVWGRVHCN